MHEDYDVRIERVADALSKAERIVVGGGAGLSTAAGIDYGGTRFRTHFDAWAQRYGLTDMYTAGFYPFRTEEERWAYWARHILVNRFDEPATPLYRMLLALVREQDYFVITTNVEKQFAKAGFSENRLFEVQGDYGLIQCARGCHDTLYPDEDLVRRMVAETKELRVPTNLVPECPVCGGAMDVHVRKSAAFVQDAAWYAAAGRYDRFVSSCEGHPTVLLELGVGFNTPTIIRMPFERMARERPDEVTLVRLNRDEPDGLEENRAHTISFTEDMMQVLSDLERSGTEREGVQ